MAGGTVALGAMPTEFRPSVAGWAARGAFALALAVAVFGVPLLTGSVWDFRIALAAIYAVIGLSVNIITGYAGQISLGHQAFVGIGAFMSAFVVGKIAGAGFFIALPVAGFTGALMALALGLVALRIRGLYLALVTLAFGRVAEVTIFNWRDFTGGGAGAAAPRPSLFASDQAYAYLCLLLLGLFLVVDWRLAKSKAGRAVVALRNNDQVARTLGVNIVAYKLIAFAAGGFLAGAAGSLYGHLSQTAAAADYDLTIALTWVLMAVVGGLGSRAGVVIGSAFFALFPALLPSTPVDLPLVGARNISLLTPLIGALLLLVTLTMYPGGIGEQLLPIRRWLAGGRLALHRPSRRAGDITAQPDTVEARSADDGGDRAPGITQAFAVPESAEPAGNGPVPSDTVQLPAVKAAPVRRKRRNA
ncbi:MAG: branched-chain amino acid ABC transporter permease [Actinomycetota bacterium]